MEHENKNNERIGLFAILAFLAGLPLALSVWFASWGWAFTAWHWALACFKG